MDLDPITRFTNRVDAYSLGRPGYPAEVASLLIGELGLPPGALVADLGSGTGLSCEPFLEAGLRVIGVEPNAAMREAGDRRLARFAAFHSVEGTAEATGLAGSFVDLVVAAQAFHWFDVAATRCEALRILRPPARAALLWNDRRTAGSAFAEGYERLLLEFGTDYLEVRHRHDHEPSIDRFFGGDQWRERVMPNPADMDFATLAARITSASYMPASGTPAHDRLMTALADLFNATQYDGTVVMDHDLRIFHGHLLG